MAKIDVNKVAEILRKNQVEPALLRRIVEEMQLLTQPDPQDDIKPPTAKKQFVVMVSDAEGKLPKDDFVAWVLQIPESESPATTQDRIFRGAYDFNASKRGRLLPVKSVGEALESVPAKHFKDTELWVKTKTPVLLIRTDNELPDGAGSESVR